MCCYVPACGRQLDDESRSRSEATTLPYTMSSASPQSPQVDQFRTLRLGLYRKIYVATVLIFSISLVVGLLSNLIRFREIPAVGIDLVRDPDIYIEQGEFSRALQQYETEARLMLDPSVNAKIGNVYLQMKDFERAKETLEKAIEANPNHAESHARLAMALRNLNQTDEAAKSFEKALNLKPSSTQIRLAYADFLESIGRQTEALSQYEMLVLQAEGDEASRAHEALGFLRSDLNEPELAERSFRKALELDSKNAVASSGLAVLLVEQKRIQEALEYFAKAVELEPDNEDSIWNYANALRDAGQPTDALDELTKLRKLTKDAALAREVDAMIQSIGSAAQP